MVKSTNKIRSTKKTVMALLGILVAILLLFQQPFTYNQSKADEVKTEGKTEKSEDSSRSEYQIVAYQVLIPVLQFNLFHSFNVLIEIPTLEEGGFSEYTPDTKVFLNFFQTLFRKIISPNAP